MNTLLAQEVSGIQGLSVEEVPRNQILGGKFSLPPDVDTKKFSFKWVIDGPSIIDAGQPQFVSGTNIKADGWVVWKENAGKKAHTRVIGKRTYVLLCRPKSLQVALNRIYGATSRSRVNRELEGETVASNESNDFGMLTNKDLQQIARQEEGATTLPPVFSPVNPQSAAELNGV